MPRFICQTCGAEFTLSQGLLDRYPGWTPKQCRSCKEAGTKQKPVSAPDGDPQTGVFTDGGCVPNPGPGGWGAVYVIDGEIISEATATTPTRRTTGWNSRR